MKFTQTVCLTLIFVNLTLISFADSRRLKHKTLSSKKKSDSKERSANSLGAMEVVELSPEVIHIIFDDLISAKHLPSPESVVALILQAKKLLKEEKNIHSIELEEGQSIVIVGDLLGHFSDFSFIFSEWKFPTEKKRMAFLGNYADQGPAGVEVVISLLCLKILYPEYVYLGKGNHESNLVENGTFLQEAINKYDIKIALLFYDLFSDLPFGFLLNNQYLLLHGGIPIDEGRYDNFIEDFNKKDRGKSVVDEELFQEILWNEPLGPYNSPALDENDQPMKYSNGYGYRYRRQLVRKFLNKNELKGIIRSGTLYQDQNGFQPGYTEIIDKEVGLISIFSASNFKGGNNGMDLQMTLIDENNFKTDADYYFNPNDMDIERE